MPTPHADNHEVHAQLHAAARDLDRLQALLDEACAALLDRFADASASLRLQPPATAGALAQLDRAVLALQFQDQAQQLIVHARGVLAHCGDRLAGRVATGPRPGPNPVAEAGVDAGSVDLF